MEAPPRLGAHRMLHAAAESKQFKCQVSVTSHSDSSWGLVFAAALPPIPIRGPVSGEEFCIGTAGIRRPGLHVQAR